MSSILVTGASGGIGRAIAGSLAERGVRVILHYHSDAEAAEQVRRQLPGAGHITIRADLTDAKAVERSWRELTGQSVVDAVVNNSGIFPEHPPLTTDYAAWGAAWQRTLAVNLVGPANLSFLAARTMAAQGGGRIINISSRGAFRGEPTMPAYGASKAGLNALSQSLAKALAPQRVYVFAIAPGWVATERLAMPVQDKQQLADLPLGRVASAEEVAQIVSYCALDAPASMTGAIIDVNGASYLRS